MLVCCFLLIFVTILGVLVTNFLLVSPSENRSHSRLTGVKGKLSLPWAYRAPTINTAHAGRSKAALGRRTSDYSGFFSQE